MKNFSMDNENLGCRRFINHMRKDKISENKLRHGCWFNQTHPKFSKVEIHAFLLKVRFFRSNSGTPNPEPKPTRINRFRFWFLISVSVRKISDHNGSVWFVRSVFGFLTTPLVHMALINLKGKVIGLEFVKWLIWKEMNQRIFQAKLRATKQVMK